MPNQDDMDEFADIVSNAPPPEMPKASSSRCDEVASEECHDPSKPSQHAKMWATTGRDCFPAESAIHQLNPGQYTVKFCHSRGIYFSERDINLDDLLILPDSNSENVLTHIDEFWANEPLFRKYGFLWKRGIMLWGPPGSGKTSCVQQLAKQIVDAGGITVYCVDPNLTAKGLELMRIIEPDRPLIVIFEDLDAIVQSHGESDLLAMLDGELQVDNVVFVATTNYPNLLDKRFINRPSRFDEIIKIGMPSAQARQFFLEHKNPRLQDEPLELTKWVELTDGFSIAHLKEVIISVECFNKPLLIAIKRLRSMIDATASSYESNASSFKGFAG